MSNELIYIIFLCQVACYLQVTLKRAPFTWHPFQRSSLASFSEGTAASTISPTIDNFAVIFGLIRSHVF